jgi:hypothetical protein
MSSSEGKEGERKEVKDERKEGDRKRYRRAQSW